MLGLIISMNGVRGVVTKEAYEAWFEMVKLRLPRHINKAKIKDHPQFITEKLLGLKKEQFGYDCFGLSETTKTSLMYIDHFKLKIKFPNIKLIVI